MAAARRTCSVIVTQHHVDQEGRGVLLAGDALVNFDYASGDEASTSTDSTRTAPKPLHPSRV